MLDFYFKDFKLDFIIIGVQKAGTSALHSYLDDHSNIAMSRPKELHFFDDDKYFLNIKPNYNILKSFFPKKISKNKIYGEATPIYFYWNNCLERIYKYNKKIKLILILRNPIDRAFSHWNMEVSKNNETRSFEECVKKEIRQINSGKKKKHRVNSYVERGLYYEQLNHLFSIFEKDQIFIVKYENFLNDNFIILNEICEFLGLPLINAKQLNKKRENKIVYQSTINSEIKKELIDYFLPNIQNLEKELGWDCNDWKK
ncbi:MAG: sulfotransferase [Mesonia sp.]|uniref:sulfotransferase family protein n=1 Tax=Mesonia sp. TaxID=1960830 RepID=UPI003242E14C